MEHDLFKSFMQLLEQGTLNGPQQTAVKKMVLEAIGEALADA